MKSDRWTRLEQLFDSAIKLAPEQRNEFLDRACAGDSDLRSQVESLLEADSANHLLDAAVESAAVEFVDSEKERKKTIVACRPGDSALPHH